MKTMLSALVPLLLVAPAAVAAEPISSRPVAVSTAGVDLTTRTGAADLLERVRDAADRGCRQDANWDRWSRDYDRCREATVAAVVARIDAPLLTALHRGDTPTMVAAAK